MRYASLAPDKIAARFLVTGDPSGPIQEMTYQQVLARSGAVALALGDSEPGARVVLLFPAGLDFMPAFLGVLAAGAVAVPAPPPEGRIDRTLPRLEAITADCGATVILTDSATARAVRKSGVRLP